MTSTALNDEIAATYDEVPYGFRVYAGAQPTHLAAAAVLRGVVPPRVSHSRVLEFGCAEGGLLVHLAEEFPEATFVGLELSQGHVDLAQEHIAALGLRNVEVRQADILDLDPESSELGTFDYVISHGVYSWVPEGVRDRVLALSRAYLNPNGLAYVSYNTFPMWHSCGVLRDLLLDGTREVRGTSRRVAMARRLLSQLLEQLDPSSEYEALLGDWARRVHGWRDADIAHEYLSPVNDAVYLHEFVAHVAAHRLRYLDDLVVPVAAPDAGIGSAPPSSLDDVRDQQTFDLLRGTPFRAALLCRGELNILAEPDPSALRSLHVMAMITPPGSSDRFDDSMEQFGFAKGQSFTTAIPAVKVALSILAERWPASVPLPDLLDQTARTLGSNGHGRVGDTETVVRELAALYRRHLVFFLAEPVGLVTTVSDRPAVAAATRHGMEHGEQIINRHYRTVDLEPPMVALVQLLDGTRTQAELVQALVEETRSGNLSVTEDSHDVTDLATLEVAFATYLPQALDGLARVGMLVR